MDSQGYVLLSVIADFKRIKALTEDMDLLRHVCSQLRTIEFRPGEDGVDRLRRRDGWDQWVRPIDERDPSARNDGPPTASRPPYRKNASSERSQFAGPAFTAPPYRNGPMWHSDVHREGSSFPYSSTLYPNAPTFDAHVSETPVATTGPDVPSRDRTSPSNDDTAASTEKQASEPLAAEGANGLTANGHAPGVHGQQGEDVFPDDKVANLMVVVRKPDALSPSIQPSFLSNASRTFSHGSIDGQVPSPDAQLNDTTITGGPSLRGGSGSAEQ